jgi:hypothetical protein
VADHVGKLAGGGDRSSGNDGLGDPTGEPGLPIVSEEHDQGVLIGPVDDVGAGAPHRRVHAHVERRVTPVRKTAFGHIELRRADTEVKEDTGQATLVSRGAQLVLEAVHDVAERVEPGPADDGTGAEDSQLAGGRGHGDRIAVDAEERDSGVSLEEATSVTGTAQGGIEYQTGRHLAEEIGDLGRHYRLMGEGLVHPQPLDRHVSCGWSAATVRPGKGGGGFSQLSGRGTAHGPDTFDVDVVPGHRGLARLEGCESGQRGGVAHPLGQLGGRQGEGGRGDPTHGDDVGEVVRVAGPDRPGDGIVCWISDGHKDGSASTGAPGTRSAPLGVG